MESIHHLLAFLLLLLNTAITSALPQHPHSLSTDVDKPAAVWNNVTSIRTHSDIVFTTCGVRLHPIFLSLTMSALMHRTLQIYYCTEEDWHGECRHEEILANMCWEILPP